MTLDPSPSRIAGRPAAGAQPLLDQRGEHVLLGEGLGADRVLGAGLRQGRNERACGQQQKPQSARRDPPALAARQAHLHQRQQLIDGEREHGRATQPNSTTPSSAFAGR